LRDAVRYQVPPLTTLRTLLAASVCSAVFDGQLLFRRDVPPPDRVVDLIRGRLRVHAVGAAPADD
ncbi:MAG: hypothetical protein GWN85_11020, partial [Gemmatimonadetes bacterium]|nr:hypothetical protein [Gemmatimonadota bacterium]